MAIFSCIVCTTVGILAAALVPISLFFIRFFAGRKCRRDKDSAACNCKACAEKESSETSGASGMASRGNAKV